MPDCCGAIRESRNRRQSASRRHRPVPYSRRCTLCSIQPAVVGVELAGGLVLQIAVEVAEGTGVLLQVVHLAAVVIHLVGVCIGDGLCAGSVVLPMAIHNRMTNFFIPLFCCELNLAKIGKNMCLSFLGIAIGGLWYDELVALAVNVDNLDAWVRFQVLA